MNINEETLLGMIFYSLNKYHLEISIDDINEYVLILKEELNKKGIQKINIKIPNINHIEVTDHWRENYDVINDKVRINYLVINEKRDVTIISRSYEILTYELLKFNITKTLELINSVSFKFKNHYNNKKIKKISF